MLSLMVLSEQPYQAWKNPPCKHRIDVRPALEHDSLLTDPILTGPQSKRDEYTGVRLTQKSATISWSVNHVTLTCTKERVVSDKCFFKMNIDLVKAGLKATLESTVLLARLVLDEIGILECILEMLLDHLE